MSLQGLILLQNLVHLGLYAIFMRHCLSLRDFTAAVHRLFLFGSQLHSGPALPLLRQENQTSVLVSEVLDLDLELADPGYFGVAFQTVYSGLLLKDDVV